ncbi:MAG: carbohydrate-binding family 9-like protein [Balneolaceae bacterium]
MNKYGHFLFLMAVMLVLQLQVGDDRQNPDELLNSLFATVNAQDTMDQEQPFQPEPDESVFLSVYSPEEAAELTANPESPFWRDVTGITFDRRINTGEVVPALHTDVRSRWTDTHLYFMFVCSYEEANLRPNPVTDVQTNQLWNHDVMEVYIGANFVDITKYYELQVSPQGEYLDMKIDQTLPGIGRGDEWLWDSGWEVKARHNPEDRVWYGEFRLPIASIDERSAQTGNEFRINLYRLQGPHPGRGEGLRDFIAWQPTFEYHPHRPQYFGRLKLVEKP